VAQPPLPCLLLAAHARPAASAAAGVDAGSTGFRNDVTTSRGPWPDPQTGARRGVSSTTPNPSRIGQTSRIPMESNFCIYFRTPSLDPTRIVNAPQPSLPI
jgi:hypothetical protein